MFKDGDIIYKPIKSGNPSINNCGFLGVVFSDGKAVRYIDTRSFPPHSGGNSYQLNHEEWQYAKGTNLLRALYFLKTEELEAVKQRVEKLENDLSSIEYCLTVSKTLTIQDELGIS